MNEEYSMHWNRTAYECYLRGCNCWMCPTQELISEKCRMKYAVMELIRKYGVEKMNKKYEEYLSNEADKYFDGCLPEVVGYEDVYEFTDEDGQAVASRAYSYSCENCSETDCEYWSKYNE